jgi:ribose transport system ATP-binding protein
VALLSIDRLSKTFPGTRALDGVSLDVDAGEVHALVGHNGSGKSTLIKILAGFHEPDDDSGPITVDGSRLRPRHPEASRSAGLRFIHQELGLVDDLSVLENLRLGAGGYHTGVGWYISRRKEQQWARDLLDRFELDVPPEAPYSELSAVQKTGVAVARALQDEDDVRVVVFDEPTARLPDEQVQRLFALVRRVASKGTAVIYVSHRLEEVYELADRLTVLSDGRVAGTGTTLDIPRGRLVELIAGSVPVEVSHAASDRRATGAELLRMDEVSAGSLLAADLSVSSGEIVGLAGLSQSGVHSVPRLLLGEEPIHTGTLTVNGTRIGRPCPSELRRLGAAELLPDRHLKGIASFSLRENITLADTRPFWRGGLYRHGEERAAVTALLDRFDVIPRNSEHQLSELSGGNQQKVSVAKWFRTTPRLLVLDEPTQGVDVGGRAQILRFLQEARETGMGVVICSSDLDDLAEVCDRVVVFRSGRSVCELNGVDVTRENIIHESYRSTDND